MAQRMSGEVRQFADGATHVRRGKSVYSGYDVRQEKSLRHLIILMACSIVAKSSWLRAQSACTESRHQPLCFTFDAIIRVKAVSELASISHKFLETLLAPRW